MLQRDARGINKTTNFIISEHVLHKQYNKEMVLHTYNIT